MYSPTHPIVQRRPTIEGITAFGPVLPVTDSTYKSLFMTSKQSDRESFIYDDLEQQAKGTVNMYEVSDYHTFSMSTEEDNKTYWELPVMTLPTFHFSIFEGLLRSQ